MPNRKAVFILAGVLAILATWNWYLEAQDQKRPELLSPFKVLGTQDNPPVTLFEHQPSKTCYIGWKTGGLIAVDSEVCKKNGGFFLPIILPIIPPDGVVSPER